MLPESSITLPENITSTGVNQYNHNLTYKLGHGPIMYHLPVSYLSAKSDLTLK
jgi:hypothetical protein